MTEIDITSKTGKQAFEMVLQNIHHKELEPWEIEEFKNRMKQSGHTLGACHMLPVRPNGANGLVACLSLDTGESGSLLFGPYAQNETLVPSDAEYLIREAQRSALNRKRRTMNAQLDPKEELLRGPLKTTGFRREDTYVTCLLKVTSETHEPKIPHKLSLTPWRRGLESKFANIIRKTFEKSAERTESFENLNDEQLMQEFKASGLHQTEFWYLARLGEESVGVLLVNMVKNTGRLRYMGIVPKHRGQKYGTELISHTVDLANKEKWTTLILDVAEQNEYARKHYDKFGFKCHCTKEVWRVDLIPNA